MREECLAEERHASVNPRLPFPGTASRAYFGDAEGSGPKDGKERERT